MKVPLIFLAALLALPEAAVAQQSFWFLLPLRAHHALVVVTGSRAEKIKDFGGAAWSYGESPSAVAFVSGNQNGSEFEVVNIASHQVTLSVPISGFSGVAWIRGPSPTLMLTDRAAYFITFQISNGRPVRNDAGTFYSLTEVSLPEGQSASYPLPKDCLNPMVTSYQGIPLIYSWDANCIVTFDPASKALERRLSLQDIGDILAKEKLALRSRAIPSNAESSFVVVPDAGVYRLSKLGTLDAVLDANLHPVQLPRQSLQLTPQGSVWEALPGRFSGQPAIGVIQEGPAGFHIQNGKESHSFQYIDARSMAVKWSITLPADAVSTSVQLASGNAVSYVDRRTETLDEVSPSGIQTLLSLVPMQSLISPDDGPFALTGATLLLSEGDEIPGHAQGN
ncbi:MAG TPA: hypothetical protein VHY19_07405 [Steroidobacteraceae bacterium]|nr:hypothetical protein [Steroidobacteraceae bacterium]